MDRLSAQSSQGVPSMLQFLVNAWKRWLKPCKSAPSGRPPRRRLELESLEVRDLLASLLYLGAGGNWSAVGAWKETALGGAAFPNQGDTLIFDPTMMVGGVQGSNAGSTDDYAGLGISAITINPAFSGTISLGSNSLV